MNISQDTPNSPERLVPSEIMALRTAPVGFLFLARESVLITIISWDAPRCSPQLVCFESREEAALLIKAASELGCKGPEANGVRETHTDTQLRDSDGENCLWSVSSVTAASPRKPMESPESRKSKTKQAGEPAGHAITIERIHFVEMQ